MVGLAAAVLAAVSSLLIAAVGLAAVGLAAASNLIIAAAGHMAASRVLGAEPQCCDGMSDEVTKGGWCAEGGAEEGAEVVAARAKAMRTAGAPGHVLPRCVRACIFHHHQYNYCRHQYPLNCDYHHQDREAQTSLFHHRNLDTPLPPPSPPAFLFHSHYNLEAQLCITAITTAASLPHFPQPSSQPRHPACLRSPAFLFHHHYDRKTQLPCIMSNQSGSTEPLSEIQWRRPGKGLAVHTLLVPWNFPLAHHQPTSTNRPTSVQDSRGLVSPGAYRPRLPAL